MDKMEAISRIKTILSEQSNRTLENAHNRYCEVCNFPEDRIYRMAAFNEVMTRQNASPKDIAVMISHGSFRSWNDYFCFSCQGNLESADDIADFEYTYDPGEVARYMLNYNDDCGIVDVRDVLEEVTKEN